MWPGRRARTVFRYIIFYFLSPTLSFSLLSVYVRLFVSYPHICIRFFLSLSRCHVSWTPWTLTTLCIEHNKPLSTINVYHVAADVRFLLVCPASLCAILFWLDISYSFRFFYSLFCIIISAIVRAIEARNRTPTFSPSTLYRASLWRLKVQLLYASRKQVNCILRSLRVSLLRFNCWQSWAAYHVSDLLSIKLTFRWSCNCRIKTHTRWIYSYLKKKNEYLV